MARVINRGKQCIVVEAKNIGALKAMKDIGSEELNGMEQLVEETIKAATESLPDGYIVVDVKTQILPNGRDCLVTLLGEKSQ